MKTVNLIQGTQEWLHFRRTRITATDFRDLITKKLTSEKLISQKRNAEVLPDNRYFAWGREQEPIILSYLTEFKNVATGSIITYDDNDQIMASLDAYDSQVNAVIEIKTTHKTDINQLIEYYKWQIVHQAYAAGFDTGYLAIGIGVDFILQKIIKQKINISEILPKEKWLEICNKFLEQLNEEI